MKRRERILVGLPNGSVFHLVGRGSSLLNQSYIVSGVGGNSRVLIPRNVLDLPYDWPAYVRLSMTATEFESFLSQIESNLADGTGGQIGTTLTVEPFDGDPFAAVVP